MRRDSETDLTELTCTGKMARKGKDTEVQVFVKTEEEWERLLEPQVLFTAHCALLTTLSSYLHSGHANRLLYSSVTNIPGFYAGFLTAACHCYCRGC